MRLKIALAYVGLAALLVGAGVFVYKRETGGNHAQTVADTKLDQAAEKESTGALGSSLLSESPKTSPSPSSGTHPTATTQPQVQGYTYTPKPYSAEEQAAVDQVRAKYESEQAALQESQRQRNCQLVKDNYPVYANQLNVRHQSNLDAIKSNHAQRGTLHWGVYQADVDKENTRYQQEVSKLESDTASKLVQYGCA